MERDATIEILFYETWGNGKDTEEGGQGVFVQLSLWKSLASYSVPDHYVLQSAVMVDGDLVVDAVRLSTEFTYRPASQIRKAISLFDDLLKNHPQLVGEAVPA